jgi:hypothetical protein
MLPMRRQGPASRPLSLCRGGWPIIEIQATIPLNEMATIIEHLADA